MKAHFLVAAAATIGLTLVACGDSDTNPNTGGAGPGGGGGSPSTGGSGPGGTGGSPISGTGGTGGQGGGVGGQDNPAPEQDWTRDILSTDLELDVGALTGKATIVLKANASMGASFEIGDLTILSVENAAGPLNFDTKDLALPAGQQLDVGVPSDGADATIIVTYTFTSHGDSDFNGWMGGAGVSFLWPYFCGNLFPCKSDPADGVKFKMHVTGAPAGSTVVYPQSIPGDAPSYMPAIAIGDFTKLDLGTTTKGTKVSTWYLNDVADNDADAVSGTTHLRDVFDFYEQTYGDYSFGTEVGSVSANWGPGDYGGMEHHPFWHVGSGSMYSEEVHAHEAAHGWYGDGVRIKCWEDFVLSEGTATYLAARSLGSLGVDLWPDYECSLKTVCDADSGNGPNTIALPDTCDAIDILNDDLWSEVPYMKGAYFYKAVADAIGDDVLDGALADFYQANVGKQARMQDLIDFIKTQTDATGAAAVAQAETQWLKTLACPVDASTLCP